MLTKKEMLGIVAELLIPLFGKPYLQRKMFNNCTHAQSDNGEYFEFFCGFDDGTDSDKWLEFAYVRVHKETGVAEFLDYRLPDGTRMENPIKRVRCA